MCPKTTPAETTPLDIKPQQTLLQKLMPQNHKLSICQQTAIVFYSNMVVYFDFLIFLYLADTLSEVFFPNTQNMAVVRLQTFTLFAVGYFARPFGGLLLGMYGDQKGRKSALLLSVLCVTLTSVGTAFLPTYAQIGILAPILFLLIRVIQGMGFGAQSAIGWVFVSEHVPQSKRGFYTSVISISYLISMLCTLFVFRNIFNSFSSLELIDYAWRSIFMGAALFGLLAAFLTLYLEETPVFLQSQQSQPNVADPDFAAPLAQDAYAKPRHFHCFFLSFLLCFYLTSVVVVVSLNLPQLILMRFSLDNSLLAVANSIGLLFFIIGLMFYGALSDKGKIGRTLMLGSIILMLQTSAFYYSLENGGSDYILFMYALLGFSAGVVGLCPIIMLQMFPIKWRLTSISVVYNTTYAIIGGLLPVALAYATSLVSVSPAIYISFVSIVGVMIGLYLYRAPNMGQLHP